MKAVVPREQLLRSVQIVERGVGERSTLPILSHLLIVGTAGKLMLSATDLDVGLSCQCPATIEEEGAIAIPARRFGDVVKELPEEDVALQVKKNNTMSIQCGSSFIRMMGLPKEEFPQLPTPDDERPLTIPQTTLKEMIQLTTFAMSTEETRYTLNGTLMVLKGNQLTLVATDGRRLAAITRELAHAEPQEHRLILPAKTVHELLRLLREEGEVAVHLLTGHQLAFVLDGVTLISRLIEGEFPNYEKVIPDEAPTKVVLDRQGFMAATRRANLLTTPASPSIRLELAKDRLTIFKESPEIGEVREELPAKYRGHDLAIHFNPHYLLDVLKVLPTDDVAFELASNKQPGVFRLPEYVYIVLPMQVA